MHLKDFFDKLNESDEVIPSPVTDVSNTSMGNRSSSDWLLNPFDWFGNDDDGGGEVEDDGGDPFIPPDPDGYNTFPDGYGDPGSPTEGAPMSGDPNWPANWPLPDVDTDGDGIPDAWSVPDLPSGVPPNQQWNWDENYPWLVDRENPIIPNPGFDEWGRPVGRDGQPLPIHAPGFDVTIDDKILEELLEWLRNAGEGWREEIDNFDPSDPSTWPWMPGYGSPAGGPGVFDPAYGVPRPGGGYGSQPMA